MSNETEHVFVTAARKKFRFESGKGSVTCEDLFDLSLAALDRIAVALDEKIQRLPRKSFVGRSPASDTDLTKQLEVITTVIDIKQAENAALKTKAEKAALKASLEGLLLNKKEEEMKGLSAEEIQKKIEALGD